MWYPKLSAGRSRLRRRLSGEWGLWSEWGSKEAHPFLYSLMISLDTIGSIVFYSHQELMKYTASSPLKSYHKRSRAESRLSLLPCSNNATHSPTTVVSLEDMWGVIFIHQLWEAMLSVKRGPIEELGIWLPVNRIQRTPYCPLASGYQIKSAKTGGFNKIQILITSHPKYLGFFKKNHSSCQESGI